MIFGMCSTNLQPPRHLENRVRSTCCFSEQELSNILCIDSGFQLKGLFLHSLRKCSSFNENILMKTSIQIQRNQSGSREPCLIIWNFNVTCLYYQPIGSKNTRARNTKFKQFVIFISCSNVRVNCRAKNFILNSFYLCTFRKKTTGKTPLKAHKESKGISFTSIVYYFSF